MEEPHAPTYTLARQGLRLRLQALPSPSGGVEVQRPGPGQRRQMSWSCRPTFLKAARA